MTHAEATIARGKPGTWLRIIAANDREANATASLFRQAGKNTAAYRMETSDGPSYRVVWLDPAKVEMWSEHPPVRDRDLLEEYAAEFALPGETLLSVH